LRHRAARSNRSFKYPLSIILEYNNNYIIVKKLPLFGKIFSPERPAWI
jgi:hypothetical protein